MTHFCFSQKYIFKHGFPVTAKMCRLMKSLKHTIKLISKRSKTSERLLFQDLPKY